MRTETNRKLRNRLLSMLLALLLALGCVGFSLAEPAEEEDEPISNEWLDESFDEVDAFDLGDGEDGTELPGEGGDVDLPAEGDADLPADGDGDLQVEDPQPVDAEQGGAVVDPEDGGDDADAPAEDATAGDAEGGEDVEDEDADADEDAEGEEGEDEDADADAEGEEDEDAEGEEGEEDEALDEEDFEEVEMPMFEAGDGAPVVVLPTKVALKENYVISYAGTELDAEGIEVTAHTKSTKIATATVDREAKTIKVYGKTANKSTTLYVYKNDELYLSSSIKVLKASSSISLNYTSIAIAPGGSMPLTASLPKNTTTQLTWDWELDHDGVTFENGLVSASEDVHTPGNGDPCAVISFKTRNGQAGFKEKKCLIWVLAAADIISQEQFRKTVPTSLTMGVSELYPFVPASENGMPAYQQTLSVSSSNTKYVVRDTSISLFPNSVIKAKKAGKSTVTVKGYNGLSATCKVTVKKKPGSFSITAQNQTVTLKVGDTFKPSVSFPKKTGSVIYWDFYSDSDAISMENLRSLGDGMPTITARKVGTANVYAHDYWDRTQTVTINVVDYTPQVAVTSNSDYADPTDPESQITLDDEPIKVYLKKKADIRGALLGGNDGEPPMKLEDAVLVKGLSKKVKKMFTASAKYDAATKNSVITIAAKKKKGSSTITLYTHGGVTRTVKVQVLAAPKKGSQIPLKETAHAMHKYDVWPVMGKNPIGGLTYSSSNTGVATVDKYGMVAAVGVGKAEITVQYSKKVKAKCVVTVDYQEPSIPAGGGISEGSEDKKNIEAVHQKLVTLGLMATTDSEVQNVEFGSDTTAAVKAFQDYASSHGYDIPAEEYGSVGEATLAAMQASIDKGIDLSSGDVMPDWNLADGETINKDTTNQDAVKVVQQLLAKHYGLSDETVTGTYDADTELRVEAFQNEKGLQVTGEVDSATLKALQDAWNEAPAEMPTDAPFVIDGNTVKGYTGTDTEITIPKNSKVTGKPITIIGEEAFLNNTAIEIVHIPNAVTTICDSAFENCTNLTDMIPYD